MTGPRHRARRLLVATGLRDTLPDIEGLQDRWGRGVVICPYCDGYEARDRRIAVLATSPMSVFQTHLLRQLSARVTYFSRGEFHPTDDDLAHVDAVGRTSVRGLFAAGNVVDPMANVPMSMGAGARVGGAINADLVAEDLDAARRAHPRAR